MDWLYWISCAVCLYIGTNIPRAWEQLKAGINMIASDIAKKTNKQEVP